MPTGIVIMRWDERIGAEQIAFFPKDAKVEDKTLMQIYAQHEYSGDAGIITLSVGALNLVSYYCGRDLGIYLILLLKPEEDGLDFEAGLADIARQLVTLKKNVETIKSMLPTFFARLSVYTSFSEEQKLGLIFTDEVKLMILKRLREEVVLEKSEIEIWLKDQYRNAVIFDIDGVIKTFNKVGLIKMSSVKGIASDLMFFIRDIMMLRHPPYELVVDPVDRHLPKSLKKAYISQVRKFFEEYKVTEEDSLNIINKVLLEPQVYTTLILLRQAIVTKSELDKLKKKGVDNPDMVLRTLWENKMITVLADKNGTEYYALISDFYLAPFYPSYNIDTIVQRYKTKSTTPKILLAALDIMKEEFYSQVETSKAEKKKAKKVKPTIEDDDKKADEPKKAEAKV